MIVIKHVYVFFQRKKKRTIKPDQTVYQCRSVFLIKKEETRNKNHKMRNKKQETETFFKCALNR